MLLAIQYLGSLQLQPNMCYYSWYYGTLVLLSGFMACMSQFWPPGAPRKFGTCDLHLLLGVSKYVSDLVRYF